MLVNYTKIKYYKLTSYHTNGVLFRILYYNLLKILLFTLLCKKNCISWKLLYNINGYIIITCIYFYFYL